jgi:hypothetical protein
MARHIPSPHDPVIIGILVAVLILSGALWLPVIFLAWVFGL